MSIPNFIKNIFLLLLIYPQISFCQVKQNQPYNVLFIAVDDLRTELNCYGATHIKSPNIDRLANNGVKFTNAHVQQAICMASRASIMSGIRPEKRGIYTGESVTDVLPNVLTINKFFEQNGYNIASSGKIYHYPEDTKEQFGNTYINPTATWKGKGYVTKESLEIFKKFKEGPAYEAADVHDTIYPDGINTLNAMRKLEVLKKENKPFFMAVGLLKPHLPFNAPKKYWDMYPESSIKLSELTERPENSSKYTLRVKGELTNYPGMPGSFKEIPDSTAINLRRGYYASVSYIDAQVGNLLNKLEELGLRENTIVVLWGDHGYKLGDYGSWCKWSNMNIDTNIPFIFNVPNGVKGETYTHPVEALDIYPTLAQLCQLKQPTHIEGKSLVSILKNPKKEPKTKAYAYSVWPDERWNYEKTVMGYSVTDDQYNYVEWVQLKTGEVVERELYDHKKDPKETKNVIADGQYRNVISELAGKVKLKKEATDHHHNFKNVKSN
ncbi:sulfatase [Flavobacterium faecale]|uniref:sulfatase n=1 Tax=Flavobacterium faecale TaxID=1355330 RepID=UPI003AAA22FB